MKRILILLMSGVLWVSFFAPAYALLRRDYSAVEGRVLYKNAQTNQITVRNNSNGEEKIFVADASQFGSVKEGDTVLILHQNETNAIGTMVVTQPKS